MGTKAIKVRGQKIFGYQAQKNSKPPNIVSKILFEDFDKITSIIQQMTNF